MVQKSVLANGIRIVTERIPAVHSVTIGFWVENGSRHESAGRSGISHFVEHMLFKGTSRFSASGIAKEIDSIGGVLNGFTSREFSCYYAKVLAEKYLIAVDLLADILLNSIFDLDEIEKERRVILQEISMVEDTPDDLVHDLFNQSFWGNHPLAQSVLGTRETVSAIDRATMLDFIQQRYRGNNILICAAGDVEHAALVEHLDKVLAQVAGGDSGQHETLPDYQRQLQVVEKDLEQVHICLGTRLLPQNHPNRFTSYLLNTILGGSMSSRLFQSIREERGLAYSIYSYLNCHSDAGALVLYAGTATEDAPQVVELMLKELRRFKFEAVAAEELGFAKEQMKGNLLLSLESTDNCMTKLAKNEIYLGRNLPIKEILRNLSRVTVEDIQRLAEFVMQDDYLNLQVLGRLDDSDFPLCDLTLN